jgi:uncharacterized protein (TIGR03067 family)
MKLALSWAVLTIVCTGSTVRADEGAGNDAKKMEGTWKPTAAELAGKPLPDNVLKTMKLVLADGRYRVTYEEPAPPAPPDEGTVKLDATRSPRAMDIVGTRGPNQGKTILAIYELTSTTLRICYDLSGKSRPKEFKTGPGSQLFFVEYKR